MDKLRYPLTYQCKRCGEIYDGLHRSKVHVKEEHGIAWKRTRKELRVIGIHEPLPDPELLPPEVKNLQKPNEKNDAKMRKRQKQRLIGKNAYKGYINKGPRLSGSHPSHRAQSGVK